MTLLSTADTPAGSHHVLLACTHPGHVAAVRQILDGWPLGVVLDIANSTMPALREFMLKPPCLVVVDLALDGLNGRALVRQLARLQPALTVLAFDADARRDAADGVAAWSWDQLAVVLGPWRPL